MLNDAALARGQIQLDAVEAILLDIFRDNPDNPEVIDTLRAFYEQTGRSRGIHQSPGK